VVAFDWKELVTLAQEMEIRPDEAAIRASVSRAYYGAYWVVRSYLQGQGIDVPFGEDPHAWIWGNLSNRIDLKVRQVGVDGDRLKRHRIEADYRGATAVTNADARLAVVRANSILAAVAAWPS